MTAEPTAVCADALSKHYGEVAALDGLSLEVAPGQLVGLLGPNGSGKTTCIHCMTTLVQPTSGTARVAGLDVRREGRAVRREIGLVFQEPALDPSLTVDETLAFAGDVRGLPRQVTRARSDELLSLFELAPRRKARVATLSGGLKRALDIARSVLHRPRVLFLDEPTLGLDVPNRRKIWAHIADLRRTQQTTVFFTTHYLEEAGACDLVYFLARGRMVGEGAPRDLLGRMGREMLDVEGDDLSEAIEMLKPKLGPCFREGDRASFRLVGDFVDADLAPGSLTLGVRSVRRRSPTLDDVFVWMTHPELRKAIE